MPAESAVVGARFDIRRTIVSVGVVAVVAALIAAAYSGAAAPPVEGISDAGAGVRWGILVLLAVHYLAAALTIGTLLLSATCIPEDDHATTGPRRTAALELAAAAGFVWTVAGLAYVVVGFADISGLPMSHANFLPSFMHSVMSLESLRNEIFTCALALVVSSLAVMVRSRAWTVALAAIAFFALVPLAFSGHSSANTDHETSVNMLGVHLVCISAWVGGLLAIVAMRAVLGPVLLTVLRRFSVLAAWAYGGVAISGIILGVSNIGTWSGVDSTYAVLVIVKIVLLVGLGAMGIVQRRRSLAQLAERPRDRDSRGIFARAAALELVLMAAATGVAVSLGRTKPPGDLPVDGSPITRLSGFPDPGAPTSTSWFTDWQIDWFWAGVAAVAIGLYLAGAIRLHRRGDKWPIGRTLCWVAGWAVFAWTTNGALMIYGRLSFSWHMAFHMMLVMVIPVFLAMGAPVTLIARALPHRKDGTLGPRELVLGYVHSRWAAFWGNPIVASVNFFGSMIVFYYSGLFELALRSHGGHIAMIVHFMMAGYVFAWMLIGVDPGPKRWPPPLRVVVLFATISFHAFFGVAVAQGTALLAPEFFTELQVPWIRDLLADQQKGGNITWAIGELPSLVLALLVTLSWVKADDHEKRRIDRQADRDGDADLRAYNERLATIAEHDDLIADHDDREVEYPRRHH